MTVPNADHSVILARHKAMVVKSLAEAGDEPNPTTIKILCEIIEALAVSHLTLESKVMALQLQTNLQPKDDLASRAREIEASMPDEFPVGFAQYLAKKEQADAADTE